MLPLQVADLHKLVQRQAVLMEQAATAQGVEDAAARRRVAENPKGERAEDPQTVLVSSLGGGSGSRSAPSTNRSSAVRACWLPPDLPMALCCLSTLDIDDTFSRANLAHACRRSLCP